MQLARGRVDARGGAGEDADSLVSGGFARVRIDRPLGLALYGNRVGGFRVRCPSCDASLVRSYGRTWVEIREGRQRVGEARVPCACGATTPFSKVPTRPRAAVGRLAVVLADVASATLVREAQIELTEAIGPCHVIWSRV